MFNDVKSYILLFNFIGYTMHALMTNISSAALNKYQKHVHCTARKGNHVMLGNGHWFLQKTIFTINLYKTLQFPFLLYFNMHV